jgi:hypothetical protein
VKRSILLALIVLTGCQKTDTALGPPLDKLYFPMAVAHVDVPGSTNGVLFVANADADKRYPTGSVVALTLDTLGLPELGADASPDGGAPTVARIDGLNIQPSQMVQIAAFSGEMALYPIAPQTYRLYVPTRSEGMNIYQATATIDATGVPKLSCVGDESSQNCFASGVSMTPTKFSGYDAGVQWPLTPYGVAAAPRACNVDADCCPSDADAGMCGRSCNASKQCLSADSTPFADVWVAYSPRADYPSLIGANPLLGYVARLDSDDFALRDQSLIQIGVGAANSVAIAGPWVYVSGRILSPAPNLLRVVNRDPVVLSSNLESFFRVSDSRSLALSSDGKRLFMVGRVPDTLLIINIDNSTSVPSLNFVRGISLPDAPNDVKIISRPGKGDLVAVSCTAAGSVVFYDDDVGDLVSYVGGLGNQPFGLAVDHRGNQARIYVSLHGDGRIAVIDVPDLNRPQAARLVAHLGEQQLCLTRGSTSPGCVASKEPAQ